MPDALGSIGGLFTKAMPALTGGSAIGGIVGNILNAITRGKAVGQMESNMKLSPEALAAKVRGATLPLDQGLREAVGNSVSADLATRGLAQAPGIYGAEEAQTLAPFYQQNQNTAMNMILRQLGIPGELLAGTSGGSDVTNQILSLLLRQQQAPGATPNVVPIDMPGTPAADAVSQIAASQAGITPDYPLPNVALDAPSLFPGTTTASTPSYWGGS